MKKFFLFLFSFFFISCVLGEEKNAKLLVTVKNLKKQGVIWIAIFNDEKYFPTNPEKSFKLEKIKVLSDTATALFNLEKGWYAIAVMHDENSNNKIDTNWLGIPSEGVGVSNKAKGFMGPPKFNDAKILINSDRNETIEIKY